MSTDASEFIPGGGEAGAKRIRGHELKERQVKLNVKRKGGTMKKKGIAAFGDLVSNLASGKTLNYDI